MGACAALCAMATDPNLADRIVSKELLADLSSYLLPRVVGVTTAEACCKAAGRTASVDGSTTSGVEAALGGLRTALEDAVSSIGSSDAPSDRTPPIASAPPAAALRTLRAVAASMPDVPADHAEAGSSSGSELAMFRSMVALATTDSPVSEHAAIAAILLAIERPPAEIIATGALGMCLSAITSAGPSARSETLVRHAGAVLLDLAGSREGRAALLRLRSRRMPFDGFAYEAAVGHSTAGSNGCTLVSAG